MRIALGIPLLLVVSACSGMLLTKGSGAQAHFRHRELGYEIAYPSVLSEPGWKIETLDEADLLVHHPEGSLWALASNCRSTSAPVRLLARELARAAGGTPLGPASPIRQSALDGLSQRLTRREARRTLAIKTVTLRGARCTYDFILIARSEVRLLALEGRFDAWWQSFERGPSERPRKGEQAVAEDADR